MKHVIAVVVLLASQPAWAQPGQGVWVKVENLQQQAVLGAVVTVLDSDGTETGTGQTGANGLVQIGGVNPSQTYTVTATASGHTDFTGVLDYPAHGGQENDPVTIVMFRLGDERRDPNFRPGNLSPLPPGMDAPPDLPETANFTLALDEAMWLETLRNRWAHSSSKGTFFRRCKIYPGGVEGMRSAWVLDSGTSLLGSVFSSADCSFRLFGNRELNEGWTFVSFTLADGVAGGLCEEGSVVSVIESPAVGDTDIHLEIRITAPSFECRSGVSEITVRGPQGANPMSAFVP